MGSEEGKNIISFYERFENGKAPIAEKEKDEGKKGEGEKEEKEKQVLVCKLWTQKV